MGPELLDAVRTVFGEQFAIGVQRIARKLSRKRDVRILEIYDEILKEPGLKEYRSTFGTDIEFVVDIVQRLMKWMEDSHEDSA